MKEQKYIKQNKYINIANEIVTGKHSKTNYKDVRYSYLKKCYYRPLVPEFLKKYKAI